jgi:hypothetical protein
MVVALLWEVGEVLLVEQFPEPVLSQGTLVETLGVAVEGHINPQFLRGQVEVLVRPASLLLRSSTNENCFLSFL